MVSSIRTVPSNPDRSRIQAEAASDQLQRRHNCAPQWNPPDDEAPAIGSPQRLSDHLVHSASGRAPRSVEFSADCFRMSRWTALVDSCVKNLVQTHGPEDTAVVGNRKLYRTLTILPLPITSPSFPLDTFQSWIPRCLARSHNQRALPHNRRCLV